MYMYGIAVPLSWARVLSSSEAIFQMELLTQHCAINSPLHKMQNNHKSGFIYPHRFWQQQQKNDFTEALAL